MLTGGQIQDLGLVHWEGGVIREKPCIMYSASVYKRYVVSYHTTRI